MTTAELACQLGREIGHAGQMTVMYHRRGTGQALILHDGAYTDRPRDADRAVALWDGDAFVVIDYRTTHCDSGVLERAPVAGHEDPGQP